MKVSKIIIGFSILFMSYCFLKSNTLNAQQSIDLTLERAVEIAMNNSYRIKQLQLGIERTRYYLKARQAGLKSKVYINLRSPDLNAISEFEWNSTLQKDELVRQNNRLWQMELSIRQPVILFGYPTDGYLSLNNRMYRYLQKINGTEDVNYYNRYFVRFEQPLFRPNTLKNDIEQAKLDLEREELEYLNDQVRVLNNTGYAYFDLFELAYEHVIYSRQVAHLQKVSDIIYLMSQQDSTRSLDVIQVRVELTNAQETLLENESDMRLEIAQMKQRLRLDYQDELTVKPTIEITPINVDLNQAIQYGYTLNPTLQLNEINKRRDEIALENIKGWDKLHLNLEMTYGLEKEDEKYQELWLDHDNSYSISVRAYIPIWDWGRQKANIEGQKINMKRTELYMEENRNRIKSEITSAIKNLEEYLQRALDMKENMEVAQELSDISIIQFEENRISVQDILKIIERQKDTELSFLESYLGFKRSFIQLMSQTYFDYEKNISLLEKLQAG
ncbi:MAG TPA: TolC family protein [Anaerolineae bacterium]|nr:TolC family protein [Anaerolineae bacterium]